jgi:hypothetical protein
MFYDCDFKSLAPPLIFAASVFDNKRNEKDTTKSFSTDPSHVFGNGMPLSLWLLSQLAAGKTGVSVRTFNEALRLFRSPMERAKINRENYEFSRLAMISIGSKFNTSLDAEMGLQVSL